MRTAEQNVRASKNFRFQSKVEIPIVKYQQHLPGKDLQFNQKINYLSTNEARVNSLIFNLEKHSSHPSEHHPNLVPPLPVD